MTRWAASLCTLVSCAMPWAALAAAVSQTDDTNRVVSLAAPAQRIISLAPSLTELIYAAGAGEKLVAVSAFSDFPAAAKLLPQVADYATVSFEKILALKPDIVFAWKTGNKEIDAARIRKLGIPVFVIDIERAGDVPAALTRIGALAGTAPAASATAEEFVRALAAIKSRNVGKPGISVFFEISRAPTLTINGRHAIDEAIRLCGGRNIFADAATIVVQPSAEALLKRQPEAILYTGAQSADKGEGASLSPQYQILKAGRAGRVYRLDADPILRAGPRMIAGIAQVCEALDAARSTLTR